MNILFCGDENVCRGILLSARSICKHNHQALHIFILTAKVPGRRAIPPSFEQRLQADLVKYNSESRATLIDITPAFQKCLPLANMGTRFTPLCMLRLFADEVAQIPDRILYLDADVLCRGELSELYHSDIRNFEIAGVPDRYGKWFFGNIFRHDYLNSGVLLMNMEWIRKNGTFRKCRALCREKKMFMPDQSALNRLAVKRKLPRKYNEQGQIRGDTVLKHFTTYFEFFPRFRKVTVKPWQIELMHQKLKIFEFDDILEDYERIQQV